MTIIIDLIIIGIFLLSTYLGYRKGLIGVAFKIVSFLIAIAITFVLYKPVTNLIIDHTDWDENIETFIVEKFAGVKTTEKGEIQQETSNMPEVVVNYINSMVKDAVNQSKEAIVLSISHGLAINILQLIVILSLFALVNLLLLFAKAILELVSELPLIKQCNEVGGIVFGMLRGILLIYILLAILSFLTPFISNFPIIAMIKSSFIGGILYNNNLILMLFF